MPRPSESVAYGIAKRRILLERFDELVAMGMPQAQASKTIGYNYSTVKGWLATRQNLNHSKVPTLGRIEFIVQTPLLDS